MQYLHEKLRNFQRRLEGGGGPISGNKNGGLSSINWYLAIRELCDAIPRSKPYNKLKESFNYLSQKLVKHLLDLGSFNDWFVVPVLPHNEPFAVTSALLLLHRRFITWVIPRVFNFFTWVLFLIALPNASRLLTKKAFTG